MIGRRIGEIRVQEAVPTAAVEQMLSSGAFMVLLAVVALIGTPALAAQQIAFTALSTAFRAFVSLALLAESK